MVGERGETAHSKKIFSPSTKYLYPPNTYKSGQKWNKNAFEILLDTKYFKSKLPPYLGKWSRWSREILRLSCHIVHLLENNAFFCKKIPLRPLRVEAPFGPVLQVTLGIRPICLKRSVLNTSDIRVWPMPQRFFLHNFRLVQAIKSKF